MTAKGIGPWCNGEHCPFTRFITIISSFRRCLCVVKALYLRILISNSYNWILFRIKKHSQSHRSSACHRRVPFRYRILLRFSSNLAKYFFPKSVIDKAFRHSWRDLQSALSGWWLVGWWVLGVCVLQVMCAGQSGVWWWWQARWSGSGVAVRLGARGLSAPTLHLFIMNKREGARERQPEDKRAPGWVSLHLPVCLCCVHLPVWSVSNV